MKPAVQHPQDWVELAQEFMDPKDIAAVPEGQLPFVVTQLQRQERRLREAEGKRQAWGQDVSRREDQRQRPQVDPLAMNWGTVQDDDGKPRAAGPDDFGTLGPIIDAIHRRLAALQQHTSQRETERETSQADEFFNRNAERYGDGRFDEVDRASDGFARRSALIREVIVHKEWTGSLAAKLAKADRILFGSTPAPASKPKAAAEESEPRLSPRQQDWLEASLERPTQHAEPMVVTGRKAAEKHVAEILADRARQNGAGTTLDEFPD